jgi:uncharacterized membrane protein YccC
MRELLRLDRDAVDLRKGVTGLASLVAFGFFVALFGDIGLVAGLATVFVILADQPGPPRARGLSIAVMTVAGSLIGLIGVWAGPAHIAAAAALTFVVVAVATLAAGLGAAYALRGMLLTVWTVLAISLAGETEAALQLALAFAGGGLIAAGVIWLRSRIDPEPSLEGQATATARSVGEIIRSPLGWFALVRATAAAVAQWLGAALFPDHAIWASLTVILVMKPKAGETMATGLLRTIGTLLGVLGAEAVILVGGDQVLVLLIGFLLAAFGMAALQKVNYAVFVACLTAMLVLVDQLARGTGEATASDRLLATLLGAVLAFGGIGLGRLLLGRPLITAQPDPPPAEHEDQTPG